MKAVAIGPTALLCAGAVSNLLLIVSLHRTWRYWNQMKWYILMLTIGNCLEVLFTLTTLLSSTFNQSWLGGDLSCKFLMFMNPLGVSVANMALAASAVHVLLTAITGSHGNCLRHVLVLGLFVVLSLPLPLSKIPIFGVVTERAYDEVLDTCTDLGFFHDAHPLMRYYYFVAGSVALIFFPLIVIVGAVGGAVIVNCVGSEENIRMGHVHDEHDDRENGQAEHTEHDAKESNSAEVALTAVLGAVLMLLCVPLHMFIIFFRHPKFYNGTITVYTSLVYVFYSKVTVTAIVCVIFAYAYVKRERRAHTPAPEPRIASERTKLVK